MPPLIERIPFLRGLSGIIFVALCIGLSALAWQLQQAPSPVLQPPPPSADVKELELEVSQLLDKLQTAQGDQARAQQEVSTVTARLLELQKENTDLRSSLAKLKEELRNQEAATQAKVRQLEKSLEELRAASDKKPAEKPAPEKAAE